MQFVFGWAAALGAPRAAFSRDIAQSGGRPCGHGCITGGPLHSSEAFGYHLVRVSLLLVQRVAHWRRALHMLGSTVRILTCSMAPHLHGLA